MRQLSTLAIGAALALTSMFTSCKKDIQDIQPVKKEVPGAREFVDQVKKDGIDIELAQVLSVRKDTNTKRTTVDLDTMNWVVKKDAFDARPYTPGMNIEIVPNQADQDFYYHLQPGAVMDVMKGKPNPNGLTEIHWVPKTVPDLNSFEPRGDNYALGIDDTFHIIGHTSYIHDNTGINPNNAQNVTKYYSTPRNPNGFASGTMYTALNGSYQINVKTLGLKANLTNTLALQNLGYPGSDNLAARARNGQDLTLKADMKTGTKISNSANLFSGSILTVN
ncbi:MAG: hypothetical protein JWM96_261 [Alphaproteobacteria bacterium]|nr:hypothetical protein [Alphaproteobacteria bacterium]